jgi:hypothetical protein
MGLIAELKADGDKCRYCGRILYEHFGGKRTRRFLREYEGELCVATIVDLECAFCGGITSLFYMVDLLPQFPSQREGARLFGCAPAV